MIPNQFKGYMLSSQIMYNICYMSKTCLFLSSMKLILAAVVTGGFMRSTEDDGSRSLYSRHAPTSLLRLFRGESSASVHRKSAVRLSIYPFRPSHDDISNLAAASNRILSIGYMNNSPPRMRQVKKA